MSNPGTLQTFEPMSAGSVRAFGASLTPLASALAAQKLCSRKLCSDPCHCQSTHCSTRFARSICSSVLGRTSGSSDPRIRTRACACHCQVISSFTEPPTRLLWNSPAGTARFTERQRNPESREIQIHRETEKSTRRQRKSHSLSHNDTEKLTQTVIGPEETEEVTRRLRSVPTTDAVAFLWVFILVRTTEVLL